VLATNNDSVYAAALELAGAGINVVLIVDSRSVLPPELVRRTRAAGIEIAAGSYVQAAHGRPALERATIAALATGAVRDVQCDALGLSAGFAPSVHLWSHGRGRLAFDAARQQFIPVAGTLPAAAAGGVTGTSTIADAFRSAALAVGAELRRMGSRIIVENEVPAVEELEIEAVIHPHRFAVAGRRHRQWIDFQHDVTLADLSIALHEGYDAIEHVKRYTTTGMSVDQGKTSNLNALLATAGLTGRAPEVVGTTTYRPPFMPVTLGAIAGRQIGELYLPRRHLVAHDAHTQLGAVFEEAAGWMRPAFYPRKGESRVDAIEREVRAVRTAAGLFDASPLGKLEVEGPDAAWFLDRFYINDITTLAIGRVRYGIMLNENGVVIDDGTIARLGHEHFLITTTSGNASRISAQFEEWRQCEWPDKDVVVTPVTMQWATFALAGPRARTILQRIPVDVDLSRQAFPHLHVRAGRLAGVPVRLHRVSFSGELGYEISVPARFGLSLWRLLETEGRADGLTPYGTEALLLLRLEKGFLHVGLDTDGTTAPADVGWGEIASKKQADYIGKRSLIRPDNLRTNRLQLVGLIARDAKPFVAGAHLRLPGTREGSDGFVTSAASSPTLGAHIGLGLLRDGRALLGQRVEVHDLVRHGHAEVVSIPFFDPMNERLNA
jgi:sarcosine oxidase subunit alpha